MREFADKVNNQGQTSAWAVLTADIDLSEICSEEEGVSWTPIGNSSQQYSGTFDGANYTISGLYIDSSDNDQGLFGYVGSSGKIENLTVSGSVSGGWYVGGVVGYNNGGTVTGCIFSGSGSVSGSYYVGGVVGYNISSGNVKNCYNTSSVKGNWYVGGVVGYNSSSVTNCYNTGTVSGGEDVGGVVGGNDSGTVKNCYNIGKVSGTGIGGVVGLNSSGIVENCYNIGKVSGNSYVGGVVGYNFSSGGSGNVTGCYFLKDTAEKGIGRSEEIGATAESVKDLNELCEALEDSDTWTISPFYEHPVLKANPEGGLGTATHPYEIKTIDQLKTFRDLVNNGIEKSAHAKLMNDIDLNGNEKNQWTPIGTSFSNSYSGTFNGAGHTISGLYIDSSADYQGLLGYGLFGYVSGSGKVQNLSVSGTVTGSGEDVGGIAGDNSGTVTNCAFSGSVSGGDVGGVVGDNGGSVINCTFSGSASGSDQVGGVVGNNGGSVTNCTNTGEVSGPDSVSGATSVNVGGVVGLSFSGDSSASASVTNCYNTGSVSGSGDSVGGVVGQNSSGTVENCYNTGAVNSSGDYVGGVVGYSSGGTVANCYYQTGKGATVGIGNETTADTSKAEGKTDAQFASGEVAYLLQSKQATPVWGQNIVEDKLPVLTSDSEKTVYQVTINLNDSDSTENETRYTNSDLQALTPTREGYTFDGWYDNQECTGEAVTTITDTTAMLYAKWTPNTYTVTLHTNDGTIAEGEKLTSYTYGVGAKLPTENEITKTGHTFAGWYEKEDLTGDPVAAIGKDAIGDKAYWAKWEEVENPEPDPTPTPTPDPTPSGPSTGDSTGWDDIRDELENTAKGEQITIDMGDETKVPAEIFETLAGQDITLEIALEGGVTWTVNGQDIPADANLDDLDLGVEMDSDGIPVDVVNSITGERDTVQMTLAHDGDFGFTMTLTAPLGAENSGYWANLYHYDEDAEALNFEAAAKIDEDGSVTIPFSHASQYAIVIDTHSHATVDVSDLFIDVTPDAWYKDAIQYAYDNGLMTGVSATEFAPEATTTRAMIVSILARLEGVTTAQAAGFADVNDNDWYATAVNWAANVGVVNGYEDNTFKPNTAITREQLAAILMNYAAYKGEDVSNRADLTSYTDQPSTWAQEAMQWAVAEGLISGVTADTLQPQGAATRAQVAAILQRFLSE